MDSLQHKRNSRVAARTVAAMFAGGGCVGLVEAAIPGGPPFSIVPSLAALAVAALLVAVGGRFSMQALAVLSPIGVVFIALTLASRNGSGDGAMMYMWPVLWTSYFYGRKGSVLIVVWVASAHAIVVRSFPPGLAYGDRWLDVVVAVGVVAVVVHMLVRRGDQLVVRLELSEGRFRELADETPDVVFRFSRVPAPHFEYLSPSFERITGIPVASVEADFRAFAAGLGDEGRAVVSAAVADRSFKPHVDFSFRRKDGTLGVFDLHVVESANGVQGVGRDVTEIRALQAQLAEQATLDPLTGLANRRLLDELLDQAISRANRSGELLTVAFLDLDGFKAVNDTYGHDAGDAVLRAAAARLQKAVRGSDVVARYGGDEFVVVCEGANDNEAGSLVERIEKELNVPIEIGNGVTVRCGVSVGIADTRSTAPNAAALLAAADRAMLEVKQQHAPSIRHHGRREAVGAVTAGGATAG